MGGTSAMSEVEQTLSSLNGYHDDILEALRNAHRDLTNHPSDTNDMIDDGTLRKSVIDRGFNDQFKKKRMNRDHIDDHEVDDDDDIPPSCGTIRIRTLEDIIRQLEHHSTRHMSPIEADDLRLSENENERPYKIDSSVCSESSQGYANSYYFLLCI
ncbi:hypothetical protein TKK_0018616 [Trichogramma kaykai]|uniref:Uncharacterized protein n=1 Tax=Trichogramma kaykai TaxID=54128 RepID=A0ABD2VY16_9HYME